MLTFPSQNVYTHTHTHTHTQAHMDFPSGSEVKNLPAMHTHTHTHTHTSTHGLPQWLRGKESARSAGDVGLITGLERSPGGGHGNPLQYSCLENPMYRGAWRAIKYMGLQRGQTRLKWLGACMCSHTHKNTICPLKTNKILPFVITWIKEEGIMLSEMSRADKGKCCRVSLIYGLLF